MLLLQDQTENAKSNEDVNATNWDLRIDGIDTNWFGLLRLYLLTLHCISIVSL